MGDQPGSTGRSDTDFTERWTTRTYDLSTLQGVDLFMSCWSGPTIAHVIVSFGFVMEADCDLQDAADAEPSR